MKKIIPLLTLVVCFFSSTAQDTYSKHFKADGSVGNNRMSKTADGGYIHVCSNGTKTIITKFDAATNVTWIKAFIDTAFYTYASGTYNIIQCNDGGYIISKKAGRAYPDYPYLPLFVFKLNAEGKHVWSERIAFLASSKYEFASKDDMILATDSSVIITGSIFTNKTLDYPVENGFMLKINVADGKLKWFKAIAPPLANTTQNIVCNGITNSNDGNFAMCGYAGKDIKEPMIISCNRNGEILWKKTFTVGDGTSLTHIAATPDNGYITTGLAYFDKKRGTYSDICTIKFDYSGNIQWSKIIAYRTGGQETGTHPKESAMAIAITNDSSYVFAGALNWHKDLNGSLIKIDKNGIIQWFNVIGSDYSKKALYFTDIYATTDGGYLATGTHNINKGSQQYFFLQKINKDGIGCSSYALLYDPSIDIDGTEVNEKITTFDLMPHIYYYDTHPERTGIHYLFETECSSGVLPKKLISFTAIAFNKINMLKWNITNEPNTSHIVIERSSNGTSFTAIGEVKAINTGSISNNYSFTDSKTLPGNNYYRLNIVNNDGQSELSEIKLLTNNNASLLSVIPNPVQNGLLNLTYKAQFPGKAQMVITSTSGNIVFTQMLDNTTGFFNKTFNISRLPSGMYIVKIKNGKEQLISKFIKAD
ncbi:MAG TPA: T9SS type A sorting domain-containing protein [Panacibacter sp.]|nr:T9SS type A sorting domain-containing protein [Panacibacter sp.]